MVDGEDLHGEEKIQDEHLSKEDKPRRRYAILSGGNL